MGGGDYPGPGGYSVGSEVAGYRLEEQIGQGGMALVYRARDVQLGRNVALKLLSPTLGSDESFRERFIRESRAAAAVDHPNIIPIFAAGQSDGVLYIAMRFVQGGDVRQLVDQLGPLSGDRAIAIITQVASALDAAHLHGLVHRRHQAGQHAARLQRRQRRAGPRVPGRLRAEQALASVTGLTSMGQFLGTPAYVAPEQVEGRPSTAGSTSTRWPAPRSRCSPARRRSSATMTWPSCGPRCRPRRPPCPGNGRTCRRGRRGAAPGAGQVSGRSLPDLPGLRGRAAGGAGPARPVARPAGADGGPGLDHGLGAPGRLRDTPQHPPTQISHPGAAGPAAAGGPGRVCRTSPAGRVSSLRRLRRDRCRGPARQRRRFLGSGSQPRPSAIRGPGVPADRGLGEPGPGGAPATRRPPYQSSQQPPQYPRTAVPAAPRQPGSWAARLARVGPVGSVGPAAVGPDGHRGGSRCGGRAGPSRSAA